MLTTLDYPIGTVDILNREATIGGKAFHLSAMETRLLLLFLGAGDRVVSSQEIRKEINNERPDTVSNGMEKVMVHYMRRFFRAAGLNIVRKKREGYYVTKEVSNEAN